MVLAEAALIRTKLGEPDELGSHLVGNDEQLVYVVAMVLRELRECGGRRTLATPHPAHVCSDSRLLGGGGHGNQTSERYSGCGCKLSCSAGAMDLDFRDGMGGQV